MLNNEVQDIFIEYNVILAAIGVTPEEATSRMWQLYEEALTNYTGRTIESIFHLNLIANTDKYQDLIEFYEEKIYPFGDYYRNEAYDHQRTPNLTSTSTSTGTGTASTERNQTRTTTTTPGVTTVTTHKVDPYDQTGLRNESQDVSAESGNSSTAESFTGTPDVTSSASSASSTVGTTGTDKNEYTKIIHGRTGNRPTSEVIEDGMKAAAMHDILDIIISDIADQIFLQVWL